MKAIIRSVGVCRPGEVVTNKDLEKTVDTNDEWIRTRTGIEERRLVPFDSDLKSSDIGVTAALEAMSLAGVDPTEIDGIIAGSMYPDQGFPAMACIIQKKLKCPNAFAFDMTVACGFIPYAVNVAANMIESGQCKNILVVGAELSSRVLDWSDRNTCVLFGDGGGALLISASPDQNSGIIASGLQSDGSLDHILYLDQLGKADSFLRMEGQAVFRLAVTEMAAIVHKTLQKVGLSSEDIDLLVPHQANIRILDATAKKLNLPKEKVMINVEKYGNTSSASIPLALYEALETGRIKKGDLVVTVAIGGGMSWGCNIIRW
jgi:3-oxoacyl-[acyl-carrier-protein] synthase-3